MNAEDFYDQILALVRYGWTVEKFSMFDEEGVEGWKWTEPNGEVHYEVGSWDDIPSWPDSAKLRMRELENR